MIAREAIAALQRIWQAERDGWLGPVALLREEFSTKPFPTLHFPDSRCEEALRHSAFLRDLDDGDFSKSKKSNNRIGLLVRDVITPALGKLAPAEMSHEDLAKALIVLLKRIAASSDSDARSRLVLDAVNVERVTERYRERRRKTARAWRDTALENVGNLDVAFSAATPEARKQERAAIYARFSQRVKLIDRSKPLPKHEDEAWRDLATEIGKWLRKYRRNGFSDSVPAKEN